MVSPTRSHSPRSGNATLAALRAGVSRDWAYKKRKADAAASQRPWVLNVRSRCWSMAVFMNMARMMGAGPLMVMDTEVVGEHRSKPA